ncbi:hypothetical protein [Chelativorans sp. J32]|uniref:hypothetical protein n=1 Tax=Chelativorans sp. J32 TaxID=935840 RepID=UPI000480456C|nr:hypothetical protein [Chelativorans sp. J32]
MPDRKWDRILQSGELAQLAREDLVRDVASALRDGYRAEASAVALKRALRHERMSQKSAASAGHARFWVEVYLALIAGRNEEMPW